MEPLVSVGIPTYNRPEGLRHTLNCITSQTYTNLEIIVSDNCSENEEVTKVINEFAEKDKRIIGIRQKENIGAANNFKYVLGRATGDYFMWAADDDEIESNNYIEELCMHAKDRVMVFPNVRQFSNGKLNNDKFMRESYISASNDLEYLMSWLNNGSGHPIYGLFNLRMTKLLNFRIDDFCDDLSYFNEGITLHKLFINGNIRFVPDVHFRYNSNSNVKKNLRLISDFNRYTLRSIGIYLRSSLPIEVKVKALFKIYIQHGKYTYSLVKYHFKGTLSIFKFLMANPRIAFFSFPEFCTNLFKRIATKNAITFHSKNN